MEDLTKLLTDLADKLGTTVEYLWTVLIKQAQIEIYTFVAVFIVTIIGIVLTYLLIKPTMKFWDTDDVPYYAWFLLIAGIVTFILSFIGLLDIVTSIDDIITAINNPEYWALKEIISNIH